MDKCKEFANIHCSCDDCPNIQADIAEERLGADAAEYGYKRIPCSRCRYYRNTTCNDCFFHKTQDCPKESEETNVDTSL